MNVLVYVMDSVRADHLSCYGYSRQTTPIIDSIANEGTLFERCFSPSTWTRPVAASILTGLYPIVHGTRAISDAFSPPVKPLPQLFNEAGYETLGIESMPNLRAEIGFDQGFTNYINVYEQAWVQNERQEAPQFEDGTPLTRAEDLNQIFFDWLNQGDKEPFFALLWSNEPHLPFSPPEEYHQFILDDYTGPISTKPDVMRQPQLVENQADRDQLIGLYDGEIRYNDDVVGNLVTRLKKENLYEETMLIIVGDHGDAFNEHGYWGHGNQIPPYDEVIHVPFVARTPSGVSGVQVPDPVSLVDIYPTVVDLTMDMDNTTTSNFAQGESLAPVIEDNTAPPEETRWVFADNCRRHEYGVRDQWLAGRSADWKYMEFDPGERKSSSYLQMGTAIDFGTLINVLREPRDYISRHLTPEREGKLFRVTKDSTELINTVSDHSERYEACREEVQSWKREGLELRSRLNVQTAEAEMGEETVAQLRQLGYLD